MYLFTGAKARLSAVFFCRMNHQTSQIIKYSENQTLYLAIINFMYYDFLNPDVRIVSEYYTCTYTKTQKKGKRRKEGSEKCIHNENLKTVMLPLCLDLYNNLQKSVKACSLFEMREKSTVKVTLQC